MKKIKIIEIDYQDKTIEQAEKDGEKLQELGFRFCFIEVLESAAYLFNPRGTISKNTTVFCDNRTDYQLFLDLLTSKPILFIENEKSSKLNFPVWEDFAGLLQCEMFSPQSDLFKINEFKIEEFIGYEIEFNEDALRSAENIRNLIEY